MTYAEFMEEYYLLYAEPHFRNATNYRHQNETHLKREFGDVKVNPITRRMVQAFHNDLRARGYANVTCNRCLWLIKSSINFGISMEIIEIKNPAVGVRLFEENGRDRYLSEEELSQLMPVPMAEDSQTARVTRFMLSSGLRLGEALNAKWSEIDIERKIMAIPAVRA